MKKSLILSILLFGSLFLNAQKKKEIKKYHIKSLTVVSVDGNKTINDSKTVYDANGLVIEDINYNKEGVLKTTTRYKYNKEGDVIEEAEFDLNNVLKEKHTIKYNAMGEKIEELISDKEGKQIKRHTYAYDANGLKTERKTYDGSNNLVSTKKNIYSYK